MTAGLQVIDATEGWLQNVITFPPKGAFIVNSSLEVAGDQRMQFKFANAVFKVNGRSFSLPPFGKGWCESLVLCSIRRLPRLLFPSTRGDRLPSPAV